jgi:hypothetical protein
VGGGQPVHSNLRGLLRPVHLHFPLWRWNGGHDRDKRQCGWGVAARWTESGGIQSLGLADDGSTFSDGSPALKSTVAAAISANGNVLVGTIGDFGGSFFRWTQSGGLQVITSPGAFYPIAISADGNIVVGYGLDTYSGPNPKFQHRLTNFPLHSNHLP